MQRYLGLLETSFQAVRLAPYSVNRTKRLVKSPKLYWSDIASRFNVFDYLRDDELGLSHVLADLLDPDGPHGRRSTTGLEEYTVGRRRVAGRCTPRKPGSHRPRGVARCTGPGTQHSLLAHRRWPGGGLRDRGRRASGSSSLRATTTAACRGQGGRDAAGRRHRFVAAVPTRICRPVRRRPPAARGNRHVRSLARQFRVVAEVAMWMSDRILAAPWWRVV